MAVTIGDWNDKVAQYVKFSSTYDDLVTAEVVETLRDFCRDTGIWRETLDVIDVVADTADYDLTIPVDNGDKPELAWIDVVKYKVDGADEDQFDPIDPFTEEENDLYESGGWEFHTAPKPSKYRGTDSKGLLLYPIPTEDSDEGLLVKVAVKPALDATTAPQWIWDDYEKAITIGTTAGLLGMTNRPWSNAELSLMYKSEYEARRDEAYQNKKLAYTKKKQQAKFPWTGGSRQSLVTW